jgi:carbonic anhydrase
VLGVLIAGEGSNEAFSKIVATMPTHEGPAVKADPSIDLKELLPSKLGYYRYEGSLTTPPCTEIVDWLVLVDHVTVASNDVVAFAKLYPNNARPVQTDNRRFVLRSN